MPGLMAYLGLDGTAFQQGMLKAQSTAKHIGGEIKSSLGEFAHSTVMGFAGAAGILGIGEIVRSSMEATEHIRQLSKEFRVSTDTIQIWEKGAHMAGLSAEDIGNAMNRLKKAREKAIEANDNKGFAQFGITMEELKDTTTTTEGIMDRMRDNAAGRPITDEQDVAGMELMGRSGAKVLSAMQQIHDLGPIKTIDKEDIEKLHEADEKLKEIKKELTIGTAKVLGGIPGVMDRIATGFEGFKQFMNGDLSWNAARRVGIEKPVEAPTHDLKGRLINRPKAKTNTGDPDESNPRVNIGFTVHAQTKKELEEIENERDRLAEKIYQNSLKSMTVLERQVELKKQIAAHEKAAIEAEFSGEGELAVLKEKMKAEELRGQLHTDHKAERISYTSSESIGAFSSLGKSGGPSSPAAQTAKHTADTFRVMNELLQSFKGYTLKKGENSRTDRTHGAFHGVRFD